MSKEQKKLGYKQVGGTTAKDHLQDKLSKAIKWFPAAPDRVETLGSDGQDVRFINLIRTHEKALIGVFHKVSKGKAQQIIEMAQGGKEWSVDLVTAQDTGNPDREFVEGSLYFLIWKNHVILHQTSSCRANSFQDYLSWLLSRPEPKSTGSPPPVTLISLDDPLPPSLRKKTKQPVKRIRLGGSVETSVAPPSALKQAGSAVTKARVHFSPSGGGWEAIKKLFKAVSADVPDDLFLDNALGDQDIRIALELSCTKKKAESTAGEVLGALGHSLSHADSTDYTVELADGTVIKADQMKVERSFGIESVSKQPVLESLFGQMVEYLKELVESEVVVEQESFGNTK